MNQKYTLVTGAAGFIGSQVTEHLISSGRSVIAIDCFLPDLYSKEIKLERWSRLKSTNLIKLEFDLRTDDFSILSKYEISSIINEAAMPGLVADWSNFAPYYECNLSALNRLLEYSKSLKLDSFIQASTSSVYGKQAVGDEDINLNPTSPYGVSKLAAEKLLLAYSDWFGLPVKILRYFSVYGPRQRPDMAYSKIIHALLEGKEFVIHGDGEQIRSNTFVDDVVSATLLADKYAPSGSIMNVCGDETISLNDAISILEECIGKRLKRVHTPDRKGDQRNTSGLNSKAKQLLGWKTKVSIRDGLQKQVEAHLG